MPDIVEATNVLVINAELGPPADPRTCLQMLVNLGGNVKSFAEKFSADRQEQCRILFQARKIMENEPLMLEYWDSSIKQYQANYWQLLQCDALKSLDDAMLELGEKEAATIAKTILAPFSAALVAEARRNQDDGPQGPQPDDDASQYDSDDEALAAALGS